MAGENGRRSADPERAQLARDATEVVKQAASILQKELGGSSSQASAIQEKFANTRKVEHGEFKQLADRVRNDVHDLIAIASEMFTELRTDEVQGLINRFATDAHDVVDTTMNLVEHTPEAATRFAAFGFTTPVTPPSGDPGTPGDGGEEPRFEPPADLPDPPADPPAGGR